ncbi:DMT family transporter [Sphingorhabdus contaminans]|uniref:EamA family transporter n=1 Tax=Sphingorhabdus contaminans TaxID=1343899 RepID=A0A553W9H8_9SPHN|nr:EamA family transporter [Sphingorhabdus contaminans]TSB01350.1 EamA family transporter [Sphingorhabdus contaminans]
MSRHDPEPVTEPGLLTPRVLIPFLFVSLIWGSTWFVIRDQLSVVPSSWSVTYRFSVAAIGMFILALIMRQPLRIDREFLGWAAFLGLVQFSLNFNFVYLAEHHITSGLVAVIFALLIIPNAILGKLWLGRTIGRPFIIGSAIATAGVGLLMLREYRVAPVGGTEVLIGLSFTIAAVCFASISNVLQVTPRIARFPTVTILAWSMLCGAIINAAIAFVVAGPPVIDPRPAYLSGVFYLGIVGTVLTFPFYFRLIRDIGPGKAAYTGVLIPVIAMLISTAFEGYEWSLLAISGAALAMIGLVVAMQTRKA